MSGKLHSFGGASISVPGSYSRQQFPESQGSSVANGNVVAIVGSAKGGVPCNLSSDNVLDRVNVIGSVADAARILQGGNGYYMTEFYLTPTKDPQLNQPAEAIFIRVDPAKQAVGIVKNAGGDTIIDLTSTVYGAVANQICRKIEAATNDGYKVTIKNKGEKIREQDDVYAEYLAIQYVGSGSAATMTITASALTTTVTGAIGEDLNILFADFARLGDLVRFINDHTAYTCALLGGEDEDTTTFDVKTAVDIKTAVYVATATTEALIRFFNQNSGGLVTAELHTGEDREAVVVDTNFVYLTAGTDGTITNTEWAEAFALLEKLDVNYILLADGTAAVHAMLSEHLRYMSSIEIGKYRQGGSGASTTTNTEALRIAELKALNDARFEYAVTPFRRYDTLNNNAVRSFAPFFLQAMIAGIRLGNDTTLSATFKTLNVLGFDEQYDTPTLKRYIAAGATIAALDDTGIPEVVHSLTTYQGENLILSLPSMLRTADTITLDLQRKLKTRMKNLLRAPTALQIKDLENYVLTNLLPSYRDQGLLTDDPNTGAPAFSDVVFSVEGDAFRLSYTGIIPAPLHFVFATHNFTVVG